METEWIEWNGGECPVADAPHVEVKLRGGGIAGGRACVLDWEHWHQSPELDIIAYRIVEEWPCRD